MEKLPEVTEGEEGMEELLEVEEGELGEVDGRREGFKEVVSEHENCFGFSSSDDDLLAESTLCLYVTGKSPGDNEGPTLGDAGTLFLHSVLVEDIPEFLEQGGDKFFGGKTLFIVGVLGSMAQWENSLGTGLTEDWINPLRFAVTFSFVVTLCFAMLRVLDDIQRLGM